jgi:hypothetical protein
MALIRNIEPDLRELIAYVIAGARERRVTLNRLRLVKLLYLVDVERVRTGREPVTGLRWVFLDRGPDAQELIDVLLDMERRSALYRAAPDDAPDAENWIGATRRTVDSVVERHAALAPNALLDHVYFDTGPMAGAERGQALDMRRARDDAAPRRSPALRPPPPPGDLDQRMARRRARTARRLAAALLDPPGALLSDADAEPSARRVRARLHVPADCEL